MAIQTLLEDVIFVNLPGQEPERGDELRAVLEIIDKRCNCDVIISLTIVEIINSQNICGLMILRDLLNKQGRHLILCHVGFLIKCIFTIVGLKKHFNFAEDKSAALDYLRSIN
jgi:anti-anti-sigma regulatory factor